MPTPYDKHLGKRLLFKIDGEENYWEGTFVSVECQSDSDVEVTVKHPDGKMSFIDWCDIRWITWLDSGTKLDTVPSNVIPFKKKA